MWSRLAGLVALKGGAAGRADVVEAGEAGAKLGRVVAWGLLSRERGLGLGEPTADTHELGEAMWASGGGGRFGEGSRAGVPTLEASGVGPGSETELLAERRACGGSSGSGPVGAGVGVWESNRLARRGARESVDFRGRWLEPGLEVEDGGGATSESSDGDAGRDLRDTLEGCECKARFLRCEAEDFAGCRAPLAFRLGLCCSGSGGGAKGSV